VTGLYVLPDGHPVRLTAERVAGVIAGALEGAAPGDAKILAMSRRESGA
jgi:hypothetical protein